VPVCALFSHATMRRVQKALRFFNFAIAVILVILGGAVYWFAYRPLPQTSGRLTLPIQEPAKVARDASGVPHVEADSLEDAIFLQGFVTAQDRLWQMDAMRRLAGGELSEALGPAALESDQEVRRLRMRRVAEQHYAALDSGERSLLAAYARGVNRFVETYAKSLPVEFSLLNYDPRPWSGIDSILIAMQMTRSLSSGWKDEILKQNLLSKGDPEKVRFLFPFRTGREPQPGSNAWVISGKLTYSGKPILANDTHLEWAFPSPWYSIHLKAPRLDVAGFSLPGLPCVIIGHNQRIAWGITNLHFDVQDLYLERFDPQTGRYIYQGRLEQARLEREVIRVKGRDPVEMSLWVTRHGPVFLSAGNRFFSLRWMAAEPGAFQYPFLDINKAGDWQSFLAALRRFPGPGSNFVYADVDGNIGYQAAGRFPIRTSHPGDIPAGIGAAGAEWEGIIPFEHLPSLYNPDSNLIVTANQNPFPETFPYRVSGSFASHYRARQIEARLKARPGWRPEQMLPIQMDVYSAFSHFLARQVYQAWQARGRNNPALSEPATLLNEWNGQMRAGSAAALLATQVFQHLRKAIADRASPGLGSSYDVQMAPAVIEKLLETRPKEWFDDYDELLVRVLADAMEEGKRLYGGEVGKWDYGRYFTFSLPHPIAGRVPFIGKYFTIGPVPMSGSSTTVKQTSRRLGPSMRFVADLFNWQNSLHNVTIGQSGQPFSSHFRDQWESYYQGRSFSMEFAGVKAKTVLEVVPGR